MSFLLDKFLKLMHHGGPVLWVLLGVSFVSVTLIVERAWFWVKTNNSARIARVALIAKHLRTGNRAAARTLAESDDSVYGWFALGLMAEDVNDALVTQLYEEARGRIDRFMAVLSTIISAAPMLGLLGTVTGMIATFRFLADQSITTDPRNVGLGLSEAMLNTAAGLIVAIGALFPYNAFKVQADRTRGRLEALAAAAETKPKP